MRLAVIRQAVMRIWEEARAAESQSFLHTRDWSSQAPCTGRGPSPGLIGSNSYVCFLTCALIYHVVLQERTFFFLTALWSYLRSHDQFSSFHIALAAFYPLYVLSVRVILLFIFLWDYGMKAGDLMFIGIL